MARVATRLLTRLSTQYSGNSSSEFNLYRVLLKSMVYILLYKKICCEEGNKDIVTTPAYRNLILNHTGHRMLYWTQTQALQQDFFIQHILSTSFWACNCTVDFWPLALLGLIRPIISYKISILLDIEYISKHL